VLQILAVGVFLNAMAYLPSAFVQAVGRPDLTAKLHLLELPFYMPLLWFAAIRFGPSGVAGAWCLRVVVDLVLLCLAARSVAPVRVHWGPWCLCVAVAAAALLSAMLPPVAGWPACLLQIAVYFLICFVVVREGRFASGPT